MCHQGDRVVHEQLLSGNVHCESLGWDDPETELTTSELQVLRSVRITFHSGPGCGLFR